MAQNKFKGLGIALITPFKADGTIDWEALDRLVEYQLKSGADYLCIMGTTAETPTLTPEEKRMLKQRLVDRVAGRVPLLMGCGGNCTASVVRELKEGDWSGIDGVLSVCPFYNKPSQEGLFRHFSAIAEASPVNVVLYNVPGRTGVNMTAETTLRLAHDVKNIVAIKEASGNMEQIKQIIDNAPEGFVVYSGDDSATYDIMKMGGVGVVSTISNIATARMKEIVDLCAAGKWDEAKAANDKLLPMMDGLFETTNPILVKEALKLVGFPVGGVRLPLVDATPEQSNRLAAIMHEVGVL